MLELQKTSTMEEEKAAAYYDELTRKGGGAARFKQGLGFSSATPSDDPPPSRGSALPSSSSSFLSNFVRASSPTKEKELERRSQLENIQNKLKKKDPTSSIDAPIEKTRVRDGSNSRRNSNREREEEREREREKGLRRERSRSRSRSRERRRRRRDGGRSDEERERLRRRYRSSSRERRRDRSRERRRRRRSRSRSYSDDERRSGRTRGRRSRSKSRSFSPSDRRRSEKGREGGGGKEGRVVKKEGNDTVDYAMLIDGYDKMTPAERVKAKMKLQLTQTAEKDTKMGSSSQWERFDFNKDAPVDDKEIEAADDDATLVKHIGKSFRFTSFEAKKEDEIKNAHDEAMFGVPAPYSSYASESGEEKGSENENENENEYENKETTNKDNTGSDLINEKVLSKQQGSWRDRARRNVV